MIENTVMRRGQIMNIGMKESTRRKVVESEDNLSQNPKFMKLMTRKNLKNPTKNIQINTQSYFPDKTFCSKYLHALKNSHSFFSIFSKYNPKFPRTYRFLIYFLRFYGMLAISSVFYTQTHVIFFSSFHLQSDQLTAFQVITILVLTFIMTGGMMIILSILFSLNVLHS